MNCLSQSFFREKYFFRTLLITCFSSFAFFSAVAQGSLKGTITDPNKKPIAFTNVSLLKAENKVLITGIISDSSGRFSITSPAAGKYILRFNALGFAQTDSEIFDVKENNFNKDFGTIQLKEENKKLNDVTVSTLRPTITMKPDKMVVSVEGTAMAAGNTAYAVLSKTPGVFIDQDGNIQLNGRAGVTVMIDGKQTFLSARDLRNMLESMPAENLKNIEIITNPSAKYDAEGTSGILNINLKKNDRMGINGSLFIGHNFNGKHHGYSSGGNINYKNGKWNSYASFDLAQRVGGREGVFTRVFDGTQKTYFDQTTEGKYKNIGPPGVRIGSDYSLNKDHSIGFNARYATNTGREEFYSTTYIGNQPKTPATQINASNFSKNTWTNYAGNVHYMGKLDTLGTTLSADLDYVKIKNQGVLNFYNYYTNVSTNQVTTDFLSSNIPNGYDIYAAKIDYSKAWKNGMKFETGAKASRVISDNDARFYTNNTSTPQLDLKRTNHFNYKETIYAGYLNWSGNLNKNLSVQAGIRGENTKSLGISYTTGKITPREYFNLFPSLFIQQQVTKNYAINFNYTRRLTRPNYGSLNPFRFYRDPYTWVEGNPYLRPSYAHVFSVNQVFKKTYTLQLNYVRTTDVMSEMVYILPDSALTIYTTANVNTTKNASAALIAPIRIVKNWDAMNTLLTSYTKMNVLAGTQLIEREQVFYMIQSNHTIVLPKSVRVETNILYRTKAISGLYTLDPWLRVDFGVRKSFLNKKLELAFNVSDVFKSQRLKFKTQIGNNINDFDQYLRFRSFSTTLRWNFSKGIKTDTRKTNNLEEASRAGGN